MALDYDDRTDYRAFDVLIQAINNASPADLKAAGKTCREMSLDMSVAASERAIWKDMAKVVKNHLNR
tara:strand:+ start:542 stop:742 length:201 start_codon:yes stop_codon:yes gene_type:complete